MAKPALGRGLGALLGGTTAKPPPPPAAPQNHSSSPQDLESNPVRFVSTDSIRRSPFQPRKDFLPDALQELADSIRHQGILQPLIVRQKPDHLELIAGERRWRAAQLAGLSKVPILLREADDNTALELALVENLQREDLNAIEEALGYSQLIDQFNLRQEDVAAKVGKSRTAVANALRLLKLPPDIQNYLRDGRLSTSHAKVILGLSNPQQQFLATERVIKQSLNVRQTEELVTHLQNPSAPPPPSASGPHASPTRDPHIADLENRLRQSLGTKVHLRYRQGKGSVDIRFFNDQELERILHIIGIHPDP